MLHLYIGGNGYWLTVGLDHLCIFEKSGSKLATLRPRMPLYVIRGVVSGATSMSSFVWSMLQVKPLANVLLGWTMVMPMTLFPVVHLEGIVLEHDLDAELCGMQMFIIVDG